MPARKPIQISPEAHDAVRRLAGIYSRERGSIRVTLQDAASLAVLEALRMRMRPEPDAMLEPAVADPEKV